MPKKYTIKEIRDALSRQFCPACKMSHPHCRGNACEVKFVLNTLEFELAQLEAKENENCRC